MDISTPRLILTRHAKTRISQRGFRTGDVETIMAVGTPVEGGYFVRDKDIDGSDQAPRRLAGARLVIKEGRIITAYRPRKSKSRQLLRSRNRRY